MDPVTLTAITLATTAAAAATSAAGAASQGAAQAGMYTYQAGVAQFNKKIALQNADYAIEAGEVRAQESGMKTAAQIGETKAIQSGSGLDVNTGSAVDVRKSEQEVGYEDMGVIRADAARRAYGYKVQAAGDEATSQMDLQAAEQSKKAGMLGALGSILGGASSVSSKWMQASQAGMLGGGNQLSPDGS